MFGKLTQFWVTLPMVRKMILYVNVGRVTIGDGVIFILRDYLSLEIILLVLEALHMLPRVPIWVLEIHFYLLFHVWHGCERRVTAVTFSIVHEVRAPHHNNRHELDVLVLVVDIHDLHQRAVRFRLEVGGNVTLGFSPDGEVLRVFFLQLLLIINIGVVLLDD